MKYTFDCHFMKLFSAESMEENGEDYWEFYNL